MQSFLQYRRIGLAVQKQLARDQEKATWAEGPCRTAQPALASTYEAPTTVLHPPISIPDAASENGTYEDNAELDQTGSFVLTRTQYSARTALGHALTGIHARDRTTHEGKGSKFFVVSWEGECDPLNPRNYSKATRIGTTLLVSAIAFIVGAASSIDTTILPQASVEFGVSEVVESLATV
ncbi:major facilitator superfamily transporter [Lipomyces tetrasporus]|uniref:Major facilitator superfamily transporter n=1 Tax=Lipomyces tetrasporus TaxID=54092 RepID=A0AAD7QK03_9ASCO|nr:major facilitator superfamily transporter [Lipomyces tetrasporus]KAJ8096434.1 major facilitator superfamily transporter [Lipomyces tetrasporus]